jgi:RNA polymerase sigma-70 factor (ECF subfamily)
MRAVGNTADGLSLDAPDAAATSKGDAVAHDPPAFADVYNQHFAFVYRLIVHRGVPLAAVDDVVQEVFIVVHRKLPAFRAQASVRTWLAAIARRVLADYRKKRGNQPAADEVLERDPIAPSTTSEVLEQKAAARLLDELLAKMRDEQREAFVLHEIERLTSAEIAEITGANENTVRTRLRAARRIFEEGVLRQRARHAWEQT